MTSSLAPLVEQLGGPMVVSIDVLESLGVRREGNRWIIKERNAEGEQIGEATRDDRGDKGFIAGGKRGLTYAHPIGAYDGTEWGDPFFIFEGFSDVAAALTMDLHAVGRPGANMGFDFVKEFTRGRHAVVCGENDGSGIGGTSAARLARTLHGSAASVRLVMPPSEYKDFREWVTRGGLARQQLLEIIATVPRVEDAIDAPTDPTSGPTGGRSWSIEFNPSKPGRKAGALIIRVGDDPPMVDDLTITKLEARERFVGRVIKRWPNVKKSELAIELEQIASQYAEVAKASTPIDVSDELEATCVVRPEVIITPEVSGLAVPLLVERAGQPEGRWVTYLKWADGRRERRDLESHILLPNGRRLWLHPQPAEPSLSTANTLCGWSAKTRRTWLETGYAPDPAGLFKRLCERIAHFLDMSFDHAHGATATLALWVVLTYVYHAWRAVPYLYVSGPLGSGKSRVFEVLSRLVFRALTSSNMTAPALFRTLHQQGGVLLLDEAERLKQTQSPEVQELLSMLLAGYKRGGQATRLEAVGDTFRTVAFDVYCPKALGCIAGLPPALLSRCIPMAMFRAGADSPKPRRRIDAEPEKWQALRDDLHALAISNGLAWLELADRVDVCPAMHGRDFELWQPLMALAWWIERHGATGLLKLLQDHALACIDSARDERTPDTDETLLRIITDAWKGGVDLTSADVLRRAVEIESRTFERWHPRTVTARLRSYGIPKPEKTTNGRRVFRGVSGAILYRIQENYGVDLDIDPPLTVPLTPPEPPKSISDSENRVMIDTSGTSGDTQEGGRHHELQCD